jgi:hypothetical protein
MMNDAKAEQSTQPSYETEAADIGGRSAVTLPLSARKYNTNAIRELLKQAMDDDEFTAFCFDYFLKVYEAFSTGLTRLPKIQMLLDYCMRQEQYPYLLDLLRQKNPNKYMRFASQLDLPPGEPTTGDRQLLTVPINYELMRLEFAADVSRTTPEQMEMVKKAITGMLSYTLGVDPNHVHFLRAHPGSLIADVLLPTDAAQRLMALTERDQSLKDEMGLLRVEPQGKNLAKANLEGIVLAGVIMSEANFSDANLRGAVLRDAILSKANFTGARLSGAILERAVLTEANMSKADLRGSLRRGAVLAQANLSNADLSNAQLEGAVLTQANLAGANLRGTVLDNDTLRPTGATESWGHGVNGHAVCGHFFGQRFGKPDDTGLGGSIVRLPGEPRLAAHRSNIDNAPAFLAHESIHRDAREINRSIQIGFDHGAPIVFLHQGQRLIACDPGIIHEHREGTKALFDLSKHCRGAGKIRHVLLEPYRFAA